MATNDFHEIFTQTTLVHESSVKGSMHCDLELVKLKRYCVAQANTLFEHTLVCIPVNKLSAEHLNGAS